MLVNDDNKKVILAMVYKNIFLLFGLLAVMVSSSNVSYFVYFSALSTLFMLLYFHGRGLISTESLQGTESSSSRKLFIWQDIVLFIVLVVVTSFDFLSIFTTIITVVPAAIVFFYLYTHNHRNFFIPILLSGLFALAAFFITLMIHSSAELMADLAAALPLEELSAEFGGTTDLMLEILKVVISMAIIFNAITYMYFGALIYSWLNSSGRLAYIFGTDTTPQSLNLRLPASIIGSLSSSELLRPSTFLMLPTKNQMYAMIASALALFFMAMELRILPAEITYSLLALPVFIIFYQGLDILRCVIFLNRPFLLMKVAIFIILSIMGFFVAILFIAFTVGILSSWIDFSRWVNVDTDLESSANNGGSDAD